MCNYGLSATHIAYFFMMCCLINPQYLRSQDPVAPNAEKQLRIARESSFSPFGPKSLRAHVDLGPVPAGESVFLDLKLRNPTNDDFKISNVQVGCACITVTTEVSIIRRMEDARLEIVLRTDSRAKSAKQRYSVFLSDDAGQVINVQIAYELMGLLGFADRAVHGSVVEGDRECTLTIPLIITKPVAIDSLKISGTGDLAAMSSSIVPSAVGLELVVKLSEISTAKQGLSGEIAVSDPITGRSASIPCLIDVDKMISISPHLIRFVKDETVAGKNIFRGNAFVRIHPRVLESVREGAEKHEDSSILIDAFSEAGPITLNVKKLSSSLLRVSLELDIKPTHAGKGDNVSLPNSSRIEWQVKLASRSLKIDSRLAVIPERDKL